MTDKVVRYHFEPGPSYRYYMAAQDDGSWVRYSDYEALQQRVEELEEALAESDHAELMRDGDLPNQLKAENTRLREALVLIRDTVCDPGMVAGAALRGEE